METNNAYLSHSLTHMLGINMSEVGWRGSGKSKYVSTYTCMNTLSLSVHLFENVQIRCKSEVSMQREIIKSQYVLIQYEHSY